MECCEQIGVREVKSTTGEVGELIEDAGKVGDTRNMPLGALEQAGQSEEISGSAGSGARPFVAPAGGVDIVAAGEDRLFTQVEGGCENGLVGNCAGELEIGIGEETGGIGVGDESGPNGFGKGAAPAIGATIQKGDTAHANARSVAGADDARRSCRKKFGEASWPRRDVLGDGIQIIQMVTGRLG